MTALCCNNLNEIDDNVMSSRIKAIESIEEGHSVKLRSTSNITHWNEIIVTDHYGKKRMMKFLTCLSTDRDIAVKIWECYNPLQKYHIFLFSPKHNVSYVNQETNPVVLQWMYRQQM